MEGRQKNDPRTYPVVVFLHGAGDGKFSARGLKTSCAKMDNPHAKMAVWAKQNTPMAGGRWTSLALSSFS